MEIKCKINQIKQSEQINSELKKRVCIVDTISEYSQKLAIEFYNDKTELLDNWKSGDEVSIGINIKGREWVNNQGKTLYFTQLHGWKIDENNEISNSEQNQDRDLDEDDLSF